MLRKGVLTVLINVVSQFLTPGKSVNTSCARKTELIVTNFFFNGKDDRNINSDAFHTELLIMSYYRHETGKNAMWMYQYLIYVCDNQFSVLIHSLVIHHTANVSKSL